MFIYVIVCSETLKIYVGQHAGENLGKYLSRKFWDANYYTPGTRSHLYAAMRKHPRATWSIHPLLQSVCREDLNYWERHFIRTLNTQNPEVGYNICEGGEGAGHGNTHGRGNKGKHYPKSEAFRRQVSQKLKGRKIPVEVVRKSAEIRRGRPHQVTPEGRLRMAVMKGKTHSAETLAKMVAAHQGVLHTEESKQKMRKPKSLEAAQHMTEAWKLRPRKQCPHGGVARKCQKCARARYAKWYERHKS